MNTSPVLVSLAWCLLGYMFLDQGEAGFAIIASMAAITTSGLVPKADVAQVRA